MTTFISIRVSTKEQVVDGASLPTQVRECLEYCRLHGLDETLHPDSNIGSPGVFADPGVSAWKIPIMRRPGFQEIWHRIQPGDQIVFFSIDRGFRSIGDFVKACGEFEKRGVTPIFVRDGISMDTASGSLWCHVRASFAEYQSALLSERMRESYAIRRAAGIPIGKKARERAMERGELVSRPRRVLELAEQEQSEFEISPEIRRICEFGHAKRSSGDEKPRGRVFRYIRVSTDEQNPDIQRQILARYRDSYVNLGYEDAGEWVDHGVSAFYRPFQQRPAGQKISEQLQPGDLILVVRLDRIFRSTVDMGLCLKAWEKNQITFADCTSGLRTDTLGGRAMAGFLCLMAQWESESISLKTKLGIQHWQMLHGPWMNRERLPKWIRSIPVKMDNGKTFNRLEIDRDVVRDMLTMMQLLEEGLDINEIWEVLQREHELEVGLPVSVPNCGFGSRWQVECKLRRTDRCADASAVRRYCESRGIGPHDPITPKYRLDNRELEYLLWLIREGEQGVFRRYLKANQMAEAV